MKTFSIFLSYKNLVQTFSGSSLLCKVLSIETVTYRQSLFNEREENEFEFVFHPVIDLRIPPDEKVLKAFDVFPLGRLYCMISP